MSLGKSSSNITIDLVEYGEIKLPREDFSFLKEDELSALQNALLPLVTITSDLEGKHFILKAGAGVGVIETQAVRVQVRPSLSVGEFITLIHYTLSGNIPPDHFRSHSDLIWDAGFEDALSMLLCDEIREVLRVGLSRRYEERREPLKVIRGRPLWERNFPWRGGKAREIVCRHHYLTYDNLDNRLLQAGLRSAAAIARSKEVRRTVLKHLHTFRELASEISPDFIQFQKASQNYNRLTEHYRPAHGLSKIFILGLRPESFFEAGPHLATGLVLNMADLFEQFVARLMEDLLKPAGLTIRSQAPDYGALLDAERHRYASVRPDLEVYRSQNICGVIDAKYKSYWAAADNGFHPARKISNADLYQLFFYQQRIQRKHNLLNPPTAVIASPLPEEDERDGTACIGKRFQRVIWQAGSEKAGDVRLLLIPMTRFLRLLKQRKNLENIMADIGLDHLLEMFLN